jgi:uncharacterized protein (DUF2252 family)
LKFYEWLESLSGQSVPEGPPVWICGDCHLGNLGPVANDDGEVRIAIRDLDQTVIGNPAHDLLRLGLSLATAIRGSDLPGVTTALMLEQMIEGYRSKIIPAGALAEKSSSPPPSVQCVLRRALKRKWRHLAEERIEDVSPVISLGRCFWPLSAAEKIEIRRIFKTKEVRKLVTSLRNRSETDHVEASDAGYWMKGCSSLGQLRFAVLVGLSKKHKVANRHCLDQPAREICNALLDYAVKRDEYSQQVGEDDVIDDKTVFIIKRR